MSAPLRLVKAPGKFGLICKALSALSRASLKRPKPMSAALRLVQASGKSGLICKALSALSRASLKRPKFRSARLRLVQPSCKSGFFGERSSPLATTNISFHQTSLNSPLYLYTKTNELEYGRM